MKSGQYHSRVEFGNLYLFWSIRLVTISSRCILYCFSAFQLQRVRKLSRHKLLPVVVTFTMSTDISTPSERPHIRKARNLIIVFWILLLFFNVFYLMLSFIHKIHIPNITNWNNKINWICCALFCRRTTMAFRHYSNFILYLFLLQYGK